MTNPITEEDLDAIEERAKAAANCTAGRDWSYDTEQMRVISGDGSDVHDGMDLASILPPEPDYSRAIGDFISHSGGINGDILRLVSEIRRLKMPSDAVGRIGASALEASRDEHVRTVARLTLELQEKADTQIRLLAVTAENSSLTKSLQDMSAELTARQVEMAKHSEQLRVCLMR